MKTSFNSKSIAVLPFLNIGKQENEYFADGISEEIINALTKITELKVTARTSSFYYKNKPLDARQIGNELCVETLLDGSVRIINDRVRITAQLIRTDTGFHIWSESFDRNLSDIFELQDEISLLIADKIRENFGHFDVQEHLVDAPTKNIEAYKLLLKARELRMRWNSKDVKDAITYLDQSIALDSAYADAHLEKGWCIGMLASWGYWDRKEGLKEANRHIDIGLQLNQDSAIGHYVKATISFWGYWNYKDAYNHLNRSIELNPNFSEVRDALADCYSGMGRIEDALANNEIALRINPLSANLHFTKGNMVYFKKDYKKAISFFDKALSINPMLPLALEMKAAAFILDKEKEGLWKFIQETPRLERPKTYLAIYNLMHKDEFFEVTDAEILVESKSSQEMNLRAWDLYLEVCRGNHEKALNILESKIDERSGQLFNFRNDPFLEPLRNYNKYREIEYSVFKSHYLPEFVSSSKKSEAPSPFTAEQLKCYAEAIEVTMKEDKLFTDPDLSLKQLAGDIDLHPNKLSWLLNNHMGKNFNDFINQYRIKEFQKLAVAPQNKNITLLGLAYDSGFNSKTVFNTFFKKETGMTPKQWVKANS
ncbi:helix-turn-helix domain-containing protein [Maribacter luteus]|uniref:helix-turn-helix domain-containing protein n=1 Tax=Maribacter luteus TaxID=2594478 RepID=UPI00249054B4|nr:helix-turn-helix domain-containing protein [Maribacter luteus]